MQNRKKRFCPCNLSLNAFENHFRCKFTAAPFSSARHTSLVTWTRLAPIKNQFLRSNLRKKTCLRQIASQLFLTCPIFNHKLLYHKLKKITCNINKIWKKSFYIFQKGKKVCFNDCQESIKIKQRMIVHDFFLCGKYSEGNVIKGIGRLSLKRNKVFCVHT